MIPFFCSSVESSMNKRLEKTFSCLSLCGCSCFNCDKVFIDKKKENMINSLNVKILKLKKNILWKHKEIKSLCSFGTRLEVEWLKNTNIAFKRPRQIVEVEKIRNEWPNNSIYLLRKWNCLKKYIINPKEKNKDKIITNLFKQYLILNKKKIKIMKKKELLQYYVNILENEWTSYGNLWFLI